VHRHRIDDLILEPLAAAEAVLEPEEKLDGVMMADIGGSTTDIAVFKDQFRLLYFGFTDWRLPDFPRYFHRTRDTFEAAEELKKKFGDVTPWHGDQPEEDRALTLGAHTVSSLMT